MFKRKTTILGDLQAVEALLDAAKSRGVYRLEVTTPGGTALKVEFEPDLSEGEPLAGEVPFDTPSPTETDADGQPPARQDDEPLVEGATEEELLYSAE